MAMFSTHEGSSQVVKAISYGGHEKNVLSMEEKLMKKHGFNRSQLHKAAIRRWFQYEN